MIILPGDTSGSTVDITPVSVFTSPKVEVKSTLAVNTGVPAIEIPFVWLNAFCSKPFVPKESNWTTAVFDDDPPVQVSPAENSPFIFDNTTIVWEAVPPEV